MATIKTFNSFTGEWEEANEEITLPSDLVISDPAKGIILTSASYQWRLTVSDAGALVVTNLTPP